MQQLVYLGRGAFEWQEVPAPKLQGSAEALVRPIAVAICDLDRAVIRGHFPDAVPPYPFGHEQVAEVIEVGDAVRTVAPGDRVIVPFQISCGICAACRRGHSGNCTGVPGLSPAYGFGALTGNWGGALADCVRVPYADAMLVKLPAGVDPISVASCSDNLPDAWRTVAPPLREQPGAEVLIVAGGAPSIGLYAAAIALALGARSVVYCDRDRARLELAKTLGADVVEGMPPANRRWPITVDTSGRPESLIAAIRATEADGICTSIGIYSQPVALPLREMFWSCARFHTGRCHARPAIPEILDLVATRRFQPERITTRVAAWADAAQALPEVPTKLVFTRNGG